MEESARGTRTNLLDVLVWFSDLEEQRRSQADSPDIGVPEAMFGFWDDFYLVGTRVFEIAFNESERRVLYDFNEICGEVYQAIPSRFPLLEEFIAMPEWEKLARAARDALERLGVR